MVAASTFYRQIRCKRRRTTRICATNSVRICTQKRVLQDVTYTYTLTNSHGTTENSPLVLFGKVVQLVQRSSSGVMGLPTKGVTSLLQTTVQQWDSYHALHVELALWSLICTDRYAQFVSS